MNIARNVLFFFSPEEAKSNNGSQIAAAIVTRVWSEETINLTVIPDAASYTVPKTSVMRARHLGEAYNGYKWATYEDLAAWGVNTADGFAVTPEKIAALLPAAG